MIEASIVAALDDAGLGPTRVEHAARARLDHRLDERRRAGAKLRDYGIAPPGPVDRAATAPLRFVPRRRRWRWPARAARACSTERLAAFGATACKALWRCRACGEPFEHFKPI